VLLSGSMDSGANPSNNQRAGENFEHEGITPLTIRKKKTKNSLALSEAKPKSCGRGKAKGRKERGLTEVYGKRISQGSSCRKEGGLKSSRLWWERGKKKVLMILIKRRQRQYSGQAGTPREERGQGILGNCKVRRT